MSGASPGSCSLFGGGGAGLGRGGAGGGAGSGGGFGGEGVELKHILLFHLLVDIFDNRTLTSTIHN